MKSSTIGFTLLFLSIFAIAPATADCPSCPENSSCKAQDKCECNEGFVGDSSEKLTKCLPYTTEYHAKCEINAQCEWMGGHSECKSYTCMCEKDFRWFQGECKQFVGLGGDCSDDSECYDGYNSQSLTCQDKKCACSTGYYLRNEIDCRKIAKKKGDLCALDADCQFDKGVCVLGKCQTKADTENQLLSFQDDEEIEETYRLRSVDVTATECSNDAECDIENSECFQKTGTCVCKPGFFLETDGSTCLAEIGIASGCKTDKDCPIKPGRCENEVCYCRDYYFVEDGNRNCIKTMSQGNWNCLSKEWCYALGPYSYCNSSETCQCSKVAELVEENAVCEKQHEYPDICVFDSDCGEKIKNSFCIDEVCQCKGNYRNEMHENVNTCMPNIGSPCDDVLTCTLDNSSCETESQVCQCDKNYVTSPSVNNTECYPVSQNLGDDCQVDEQCSSQFANTQCYGNKCACAENYVARENYCYEKKEYGSYCTNLLQCTVSLGDTFKCRNSQCRCSTDDVLKGAKCVSSGRSVSGSLTSIVCLIILITIVLC